MCTAVVVYLGQRHCLGCQWAASVLSLASPLGLDLVFRRGCHVVLLLQCVGGLVVFL